MVVFWSTHSKLLKPRGYFIAKCPVCGQEQPFRLFERSQVDAIYGFKVAETRLGQISACEMCGSMQKLPKKEHVRTAEEWTPREGLQGLADKLGVRLEEPQKGMINDATILALIRRIAEARNSINIKVSWKGVVAGIACAIVFGALFQFLAKTGIKLIAEDEVAHAMLGVLSGLLLGVCVVTTYELIAHHRVKRLNELRFFINKLGLDRQRLESLARSLPSSDFRLLALVESL